MMAIGAVGGILYYIYSGKLKEESEQNAIAQRSEISEKATSNKDELKKQIVQGDSLIIEKIGSSGSELLEQNKESSANATKERLKYSEKIINKIDESNKKQGDIRQNILDRLEKFDDRAKDPNGIYKNKIKWGTVINFKGSDDKKSFTIEQINFDNPIRNINDIWSPFEYDKYLIKITDANSLVTLMPPGAKGVKGIILKSNIK